VKHEPCGLLGNAKSSVDLVGTDAVFAVEQHPDSGKPLFKSNRGVLENGSGLQRECRAGVARVALPHATLCKVCDLFGSARRTLHLPVRPAEINHELSAMLEIREVDYRVSEGGVVAHKPSMRLKSWDVNYIIAQLRQAQKALPARRKDRRTGAGIRRAR